MSGKAKKSLRSVQTAGSFAIGLSSDNSDDIDLFRDLDGNLVLGEAVSADENLELAGLDNILFLCIPIAELLFGKLKRNGFLLAGLVILLYKALELAYGSGYLSNAVVDIALRCLLTLTVSRVLYADADPEGLARKNIVDGDLVLIGFEVGILECRVAETVAERIQRRTERIAVVSDRLVGIVSLVLTAGGRLVVVKRNLTDNAGKRHGKLTGRVYIAVENCGGGSGAFGAVLPSPNDRVKVRLDRLKCKRTSRQASFRCALPSR